MRSATVVAKPGKSRIIFLHILRTGGTTFRRQVLSPLYKSIFYDGSSKERAAEYRFNYSEAYSRAMRDGIPPLETPVLLDTKLREDLSRPLRAAVITGHFLIGKYEFMRRPFVTFFRDPVSRLVSSYYHCKRFKTLDIGIREFAERYPNYMSYVVDHNLDKIAFIGITERYDESLKKFSEWSGLFDLPEHIRKCHVIRYEPESISKEDRKFIAEINKDDYELYNNAVERFDKQ